MIDADHFKVYNDNFGHQAGDVALKAIAGCLEASVNRASDIVARYGGEGVRYSLARSVVG
jgi:diguanylate cyclase (GGDEF)-like protein